ncbi:zincin [Aspergillus heteromorphus CBS 117.55]|uniref:Zincin n=1 Tax=Aspergillus heteromorphus CBS 117.55 TaxID=1448321 RepID=A0A317WXD4_9EURO|nr:zincin [Aspergillus heteromorphus CBS 117.55]PWY89867.1 zincin [Aspergillus heteromorphus CBS 117.55]
MAPEFSRACFYGFEDGVDDHKAIHKAIDENPRNASTTIPLCDDDGGPDSGPLELAMFTSTFWKPGRELKIGFHSGTSWQHDKVKQYAPEWTRHANLTFTFVDTPDATTDILIDFDGTKGSWSRLGVKSGIYSGRGEPSMNLGWITDSQPDSEIRGVILHEFGHALGAVHEHQSPRASIPWNRETIYEDLGGEPNRWTREKVDQNMFAHYSQDRVQATDFDMASIMLYYYPASWTTDGKGTPYNTELSQSDKDYIRFCYPADGLDAGQFSTLELREWNQPTQNNEKVKHYHERYPSTPGIVTGLNWLDIDAGANIRAKAEVLHADQKKFTASIKAWENTVLYAAGMTWLEMGPRFQFAQHGGFSTEELRGEDSQSHSPRLENSKAIVCFLTGLDIDKGTNFRVKTYPSHVTADGFTVNIDSWADTVLYGASVSWMAYPADQPGVTSGRFSTSDIRRWDRPQQDNSSSVAFDRPFSKVPKVFMALDEIDYQAGHNLRLRVSTSLVTPNTMNWHLQAWGDSVMYKAAASYFAWEN